eukprot:6173205-Pleurochrysis_carterae.AAC.1
MLLGSKVVAVDRSMQDVPLIVLYCSEARTRGAGPRRPDCRSGDGSIAAAVMLRFKDVEHGALLYCCAYPPGTRANGRIVI